MSERPQFEYHPDADQIGAFVEQALPAHEREQMLDHLAVCADCRSIVALSLPEVEEPANPIPVPARRPWWAGWGLAWPVAGALAALAFFFLYVHRAALAPGASPQQQVAVSHPPAPPASQGPAPVSADKPAMRGSPVQQIEKGPAAPTGAANALANRNPEIANAAHAVGGFVATGRETASLNQLALAPSARPAGSLRASNGSGAASANFMNNGAINGVAGTSSAPSPINEGKLQEMAPMDSAGKTSMPAALAPTLAAPQAASATTVDVAAANTPMMDAVSADAANIQIVQNEVEIAPLKHPLPSRLPVLSMAVQGRYMVAIDTRSAVFLSNDAGKHWKEIHAQWQGHAVKAALVEYPAGSATNMSLSRIASGGTHQNQKKAPVLNIDGALAAQVPASPAVQGPSLTGTVTDQSGAAIPGATVIVTEIATGTAHTVQTDGTGRYLVDGLATGAYQVETRASGFKENTVAAAVIPGPSVANLVLTVAASTQTVTVTGAEVMETPDAKKKSAKPTTPSVAAPIFEITTDNGERWTSTDGATWKRM